MQFHATPCCVVTQHAVQPTHHNRDNSTTSHVDLFWPTACWVTNTTSPNTSTCISTAVCWVKLYLYKVVFVRDSVLCEIFFSAMAYLESSFSATARLCKSDGAWVSAVGKLSAQLLSVILDQRYPKVYAQHAFALTQLIIALKQLHQYCAGNFWDENFLEMG